MDPSKDETTESSRSQVKNQVETFTEKMRIMESSCSRGSVNLDSLINFPQVIMPPKFKSLEFVKYDGTGDPCAHLCMFCRNMAPSRDNNLCFVRSSLIA